MQEIVIDRVSDVPIGVQLAWKLRALMVGGSLPAGEQLPGARELAAQTGANVNTIRSVYARLEAEGLLSVEHGRGTFVAAHVDPDLRIAGIVADAAQAAEAAGLDARDIAAALYVRTEQSASPEASDLRERQALRADIAALERTLADVQLTRLLAAQADDMLGLADGSRGPRLLNVEGLRTIRDELTDQIAALRAEMQPDPAEDPSSAASEAPAVPAGRPQRVRSTPRISFGT